MRNAVIWFTEAKSVAGKVSPPEEIGLTLPYKALAVFTYFEIFVTPEEEMPRLLMDWYSAVIVNFSRLRTRRQIMYLDGNGNFSRLRTVCHIMYHVCERMFV